MKSAVTVEMGEIASEMYIASVDDSESAQDFPVIVELVSLDWQATGNRLTLTVAQSVDASGKRELSAGSLHFQRPVLCPGSLGEL